MTNLKLEAGKGLQLTLTLIEILNPREVNRKEGSTINKTEFEFIGTIENPIYAIKKYGRGIYEQITIL